MQIEPFLIPLKTYIFISRDILWKTPPCHMLFSAGFSHLLHNDEYISS